MRKTAKTAEYVSVALTAILFCLLAGLLVALVMAYRESSRDTVPFDLGEITADQTAAAADISDCLLPAFAGVTLEEERSALVGSEMIMKDLTQLVFPALSEAFDAGRIREGTSADWLACADARNSVYLRWHSELPDAVAALFAGLSRGSAGTSRGGDNYVYEIFLLPYINGESTATAAFRSRDGRVRVATVSMPRQILSTQDLEQFVRSYGASMQSFVFRLEKGVPEAVISGPVTVRSVLMNENTAGMIRESRTEINQLLAVFGLNPDKLLNSTEQEEGVLSFVGTQGAVTVRESAFDYRSNSEGGIGLSDLTVYAGEPGIADYIRGCLRLAGGVKAINRHFAGGEAEFLLDGIRAENGTVTLSFSYAFDNIRIADTRPALTATFENGILREASLYTLTAQGAGPRTRTYSGWWFVRWLEANGKQANNLTLVYRADFVSDQVTAEWMAE